MEVRATFHSSTNTVATALAGESDVVFDAIELATRPGS